MQPTKRRIGASWRRTSMPPPGSIIFGRDRLLAGLAVPAGGAVHQAGLPSWFRQGLRRWLAAFHVTPRDRLTDWLAVECQRRQASLDVQTWFGGYAVYATVAV
jgi:S-adenosylmethionine-diacylgycerolhomoserine-N-methlytransferase